MSSDSLRVLFYHRIGDAAAEDPYLAPELISASAQEFDRQIRHLARAYQPIGANDLLAALDSAAPLPHRAVLVTFDDAYRDFLHIAWPIMKQHRVPAVLFVSTAYVEDPARLFWWDAVWQSLTRTRHTAADFEQLPLLTPNQRRLAWRTLTARFKRLTPAQRRAAVDGLAETLGVTLESPRAVLSWAELRQLAADGLAVGGHSRTHELLDQCPADVLDAEVAGCRDDLVRELGNTVPLFAYPNGNFSDATSSALSSAGYRVGFTTLPGLNEHWTRQPLRVRRDGHSTSFLRFAVKLLYPVAKRRSRRTA